LKLKTRESSLKLNIFKFDIKQVLRKKGEKIFNYFKITWNLMLNTVKAISFNVPFA